MAAGCSCYTWDRESHGAGANPRGEEVLLLWCTKCLAAPGHLRRGVLVWESKDPGGQEGACIEVLPHGQWWEIAEGMRAKDWEFSLSQARLSKLPRAR